MKIVGEWEGLIFTFRTAKLPFAGNEPPRFSNIGRVKCPNSGRVLIQDTFLFQVRVDEEATTQFFFRTVLVPVMVYDTRAARPPQRPRISAQWIFFLEMCDFSIS